MHKEASQFIQIANEKQFKEISHIFDQFYGVKMEEIDKISRKKI